MDTGEREPCSIECLEDTEPEDSDSRLAELVYVPDNAITTTTVKSDLSKRDISKLIGQKSPRITLEDPSHSGKYSTVWERFKIVNVDKKPVDYVKCISCPAVYAWHTTTGTTALNRHKCSDVAIVPKRACGFSKDQPQITSFTSRKLSLQDSDKLNETIVIGLAKDLRPLNSVEGEGFQLIAQNLINLGAKYGKINVKDCISHRTTLTSKYLPSVTAKLESNLLKAIMTTSSYPRFTFTTDMWSDRYQQRNFLSLHIHFIDNEWKLISNMLGVEEYTEEAKTTENLKEFIKSIFTKFFKEPNEVQKVFESASSVTDGGSNVVNIFPVRYPCMCHKINLLVQWTLNRKPILTREQVKKKEKKGKNINAKKLFNLQTQCPTINCTIVAMKKVVEFFKRSGLNKQLTISLKQDVETRWNSELEMLQSYQKSANEVKSILLAKNKLEKIVHIQDDVVCALIEFLRPFEECTKTFSGEKYPTIAYVALWHQKLYKHLQPNDTDSEEMAKLRSQALLCLDEYYCLEDIHLASCMLNPRLYLL